MVERAMSGKDGEETLDDLNVTDVFTRCLEAHNVSAERRPALLSAYREIIVSLDELDSRAE
jgi:exonuclease SbcD